jgi:hypothetical protein
MRKPSFAVWSACALVSGAALLSLAGCGSSSSGSSGTTAAKSTPAATTSASTQSSASTASSATTASTAATTTASSGSTATSGTAAPGTELALGASAVVPYQPVSADQSAPAKFKLRVTVLTMEKGSLSDFNGIKLNSTEKASTPYYAKVKIENAGEGDADSEGSAGDEGNPAVEIEGVDSSGEAEQNVTFFGEFPRCEYKQPPKPFTHGKSFTTCITFLVPGGIRKVAYTGTEAYESSPVTWK